MKSSQAEAKIVVVGGIPTARAGRRELANLMVADCAAARAGDLRTPRVLMSSNGSVIARYHRDPGFREIIRQADLIDADGQPLVLASRLFTSTPLSERVATTDFIHDAAAAAASNGIRFYFLGARPGVAQTASDRLRLLHPGLQIAGSRDGYFAKEQEGDVCQEIVSLRTDVLWVGLGSPVQENFVIRNRDKLGGLGWIKTCGGLFDHHSGSVRRAPKWMQNAGLEWLYRTAKEPVRLAPRYLRTNGPALYYLATATSNARDDGEAGWRNSAH